MTIFPSHGTLTTAAALSWALLNLLWQGTILTLALAIGLRLSRQQDAASRRYIFCCGTLAAMAVCMIMTFISLSRVEPLRSLALAISPHAHLLPIGTEQPESTRPSIPAFVAVLNQHIGLMSLLWLTGVFALAIRLVCGIFAAERFRLMSGSIAPVMLRERFGQLASGLGISRPVALVMCETISAPLVFGWRKPIILIPSTLPTALDPGPLDAVLAHELAHVLRQDYAVHVVQSFVEALLFFHPGVWWVSRRIRREREFCCDDLAVQVSGSALHYAKALTTLEERRSPGQLQLSLSASGGHLTMRITRLLKQKNTFPSRGNFISLITLGTVTLCTIASLTLAATDKVRAQQITSAESPRAAKIDKPQSKAPDLNCTFYDVKTVSHAGVCEVPASTTNNYFCQQTGKPQVRQLQSGCEWKVKRYQDWQLSQHVPAL
jgi:beta-lactamase regulating signal transducer with metallopeptidase domain